MRCQVVVPGSEIGGTGAFAMIIESISFRAAAPETVTFENFRVFLGSTANEFLESSFAGNYHGDKENVFERDDCVFTPSAGWVSIPLEREYSFRGSDNLVIEVVYSGADDGMLYCGFWETDGVRTIYSGDHESPYGGLHEFAPHMVLSGRLRVTSVFGETVL